MCSLIAHLSHEENSDIKSFNTGSTGKQQTTFTYHLNYLHTYRVSQHPNPWMQEKVLLFDIPCARFQIFDLIFSLLTAYQPNCLQTRGVVFQEKHKQIMIQINFFRDFSQSSEKLFSWCYGGVVHLHPRAVVLKLFCRVPLLPLHYL